MATSTQRPLIGIATSRNTEHHWRFVEYAELPPAIKLKEPALPCCPTMAARESVELQVLENMRKTILELRTRARSDRSLKHEERIGLLTEALTVKPDSPELLVHRAYCHHLAGDPEAMELDICTAMALASDSAVSFYGTPGVEGRFFRAIARGTMGYIQGAVFDLHICLMMLQGNKAAVQDVQQELNFWESFLDGPHDAGKHSPVAKACCVQEAFGVILAQEARDEVAEAFRLLLTEAYASLWQPKKRCLAPPILLRGEQTALSVKKTDAPDSPRSITAGPGSATPSSPPESPRSADLAPAQHIGASWPCSCSQEAPVQPKLQQDAFAHESTPTAEAADQHQGGHAETQPTPVPHTEQCAQGSQILKEHLHPSTTGRSTSIQPPNSSSSEPATAAQQPFQVVKGMTTADVAHVLLAVPLWAYSRCIPQWVQNKVISASSSVINVAAAMAAVGDYCKKAVCS